MQRIKLFLYALKFTFYNGLISHLPGYGLRRWYLRQIIGYKLHATVAIHMGCFFTGPNLEVGANTVINRNCYLDCRKRIVIGSNVSISPECYIITASHDPQSPSFAGKNATVEIRDHVWLGARAMVVPGVIFGRGSVAAAGAVVTKPVPEFTIVGGNPAQFIKMRNMELNYQLDWFPFFNTDIY